MKQILYRKQPNFNGTQENHLRCNLTNPIRNFPLQVPSVLPRSWNAASSTLEKMPASALRQIPF